MADETITPPVAPVTTPSVPETPAPGAPEAPQAPEAPSGPRCPTCKGPLDVYGGANPHKLRTGFCHPCGERHRVKR